MTTTYRHAALIAVALTLAAACTGVRDGSRVDRLPGSPPAAAGTDPPSASASPSPSLPPAPHAVSLPALMRKPLDGRGFTVGRVLARQGAYTRFFVTYESGGFTISGIMNVPAGPGPFPVLVLAHGYIDPDVYVNGQGMRREQDYLARQGFVVVHVDYRNHAQSDDDPNADRSLRLGYTEDVMNAVVAIRGARLRYVDGERVAVVGRSMGGGVSLNVAVVRPDLVDAVVVFASVSSNYVDNYNKWTRGQRERRALADQIEASYGSPERNPAFWRGVSAVTYFDRVAVPILLHHGSADDTCPIEWSRRTTSELTRLGKDVELAVYDGEGHAFGPMWTQSMRRTVSFLREHLK